MNKIKDLSLSVLFVFFHLKISSVIVYLSIKNFTNDYMTLIYSTTFLAYLITFVLFSKYNNVNILGKIKNSKVTMKDFGLALLFLPVIYILNILLGVIINPQQQAANTAMVTSGSFIVAMIVASVLAPVLEELLYRVCMKEWLKSFNYIGYAIISSILFAIPHLQLTGDIRTSIHSFLSPLFSGLVFSYLYNKTNSVWVSMITHAGYNLTVISLVYLMR